MIILVVGVVIVTAFVAHKESSDAIQTAIEDTDNDRIQRNLNESARPLDTNAERFPAFWDALFVLIIFGTWIAMFITSWIFKSNSIFTVIFVLLSFSFIIIGIVFATVGDSLTTADGLQPYFDSFPITTFILQNFIWYALFFIFSIGFALYSKTGDTG